MNRYGLWIFIAVLLAFVNASAEVYVWNDAEGVRHYTNTPPPADAAIIETFKEVPSTPAPQVQEPAAVVPPSEPSGETPTPTSTDDNGNQRVPVGELAIKKARESEAAELIEKERKRLADRLQELDGELERIQVEQFRQPEADDEALAQRFTLIQSEIRKEIEQSERKVEEIKKNYGVK
jgi:hypothetical protein